MTYIVSERIKELTNIWAEQQEKKHSPQDIKIITLHLFKKRMRERSMVYIMFRIFQMHRYQ